MHSIPVFFASNGYMIIRCRSGLIGNRMPEQQMARDEDICPAAVYISVLPKKFQKNYEKQRKRS